MILRWSAGWPSRNTPFLPLQARLIGSPFFFAHPDLCMSTTISRISLDVKLRYPALL